MGKGMSSRSIADWQKSEKSNESRQITHLICIYDLKLEASLQELEKYTGIYRRLPFIIFVIEFAFANQVGTVFDLPL